MKYLFVFSVAFLAWYGLLAFIVYDWNVFSAARQWDGAERFVTLFSFVFPGLGCLMYIGHKEGWEAE